MKELSDHDFNRIILIYSKAEWPRELGRFCNHELDRGYISKRHFDQLIEMLTANKKEDEDMLNRIMVQLSGMFLYYNCVNWQWFTKHVDLDLFKNDDRVTSIVGYSWSREHVVSEWTAQ